MMTVGWLDGKILWVAFIVACVYDEIVYRCLECVGDVMCE